MKRLIDIGKSLKQLVCAVNAALTNRDLNTIDFLAELPERLGEINRLPYFLRGEAVAITADDFKSVTSLKNYAVLKTNLNLTHITIPDNVISIDFALLSGNCPNIKSVIIGNGITFIDEEAFRDCASLTSVTIPNSVTSIGSSAFNGCDSLTSVTIGNSVESIGVSAFRDCKILTNVTIPDSVTSIGDYAFRGCTSLTSVIIGSGVTSIGSYAFSNSPANFYIYAKVPPTLGTSNAFSSNAVIHVPSESLELYKSATNWSKYTIRGDI